MDDYPEHGMEHHDFVVVSNRLPVESRPRPDGTTEYSPSPGGLVAALAPVTRRRSGAWVGWIGSPDAELEPFEQDGVQLVPVTLSAEDFEEYYEGFSNATLWPLYHDVIVPPEYHRDWWERYVTVNRRFAERAAAVAAPEAMVWVHDYQLQLVPSLLRELRPDVRIGYFHHVPFPPHGIFSQLPWRAQVVEGLLGADVLGFQRAVDAANFTTAVRRLTNADTRAIPKGSEITVALGGGIPRRVVARAFPISIDIGEYERLARDPAIRARADEIRAAFGRGRKIILGVDRLDYTKGIGHRIKAFGELLQDGAVDVDEAVLIQIASPSRERVSAYAQLRDDVELMVGRLNGEFSTLAHRAISYHHRSFPREEMVAMYLAADIALVTPLRDGMNLVAKEYIASRIDGDGVLILSEFTGAADELKKAVIVNPHDIAGLKEAILAAIRMPTAERRSRMRALRRRLGENDIERWSSDFLAAMRSSTQEVVDVDTGEIRLPMLDVPEQLDAALRDIAARPSILVAVDFDGTIAPFVDDPLSAEMLPEARAALARLVRDPGTKVAIVSGRSLAGLDLLVRLGPETILVGSHGAELRMGGELVAAMPGSEEIVDLERVGGALKAVADEFAGVWVERKPVGFALHTRTADPEIEPLVWEHAKAAVEAVGEADRLLVREGHRVLEYSVLGATKGDAIDDLRARTGAPAVFFAGDDVTDEDAFAALGQDDVSVKCGPGESIAQYRVADPLGVARVLARLADLRGL